MVTYSQIGGEGKSTAPFKVDAQHVQIDLGQLNPAPAVLQLDKFEVRAKQEKFLNSIDRKTYNVG